MRRLPHRVLLPLLALASVLATTLAACSTTATPAPRPTATATLRPSGPTHIRIADLPLVFQAPVWVAIDRGYFESEGLDVELVASTNSTETATLLATGRVDYAGMGPDPAFFNALERGINLRMLASAAIFDSRSRASGIVVRQDHISSGRYKSPRDLKGFRIAGPTTPGSQGQFYLERILAGAGLTLADVDLVALGGPETFTALQTGAIDAGWLIEPMVMTAQNQNVATLMVAGSEALPGGIGWMLVAGHTPTGADQRVTQAVVRAYLRGMRDFYHAYYAGDGQPGLVVDSIQAHGTIKDRKVLERIGVHVVDPNGALDLNGLEPYQEYYVRSGSQKQRVDLAKYLDLGPLQTVVAELGTL